MVDILPTFHYDGAMTSNDFIADDDLIDFRSAQMDAGHFDDFPIYYETPEYDYEDREECDDADHDADNCTCWYGATPSSNGDGYGGTDIAKYDPACPEHGTVTYVPATSLPLPAYDPDDLPF